MGPNSWKTYLEEFSDKEFWFCWDSGKRARRILSTMNWMALKQSKLVLMIGTNNETSQYGWKRFFSGLGIGKSSIK